MWSEATFGRQSPVILACCQRTAEHLLKLLMLSIEQFPAVTEASTSLIKLVCQFWRKIGESLSIVNNDVYRGIVGCIHVNLHHSWEGVHIAPPGRLLSSLSPCRSPAPGWTSSQSCAESLPLLCPSRDV